MGTVHEGDKNNVYRSASYKNVAASKAFVKKKSYIYMYINRQVPHYKTYRNIT